MSSLSPSSTHKPMVRFLKSMCEEFATQVDFNRFMATEQITNLLYIPASVLISLSALGKHGIIPYVTNHHWHLLLPASAYLTVANARDLHICTRNFFLPRDTTSRTYETLLGQMQLAASFFMTLGSVSSLNACVIGVLNVGADATETVGDRQYALSFGLFLVGSAANTVPLGQEFMEYDASRAVLTFQHIIACTLFCFEGCLMLPGLICNGSLPFRDTLVTSFVFIASMLLVFSSSVNYFHSLGLLQAHKRVIERKTYNKDFQEDEEADEERRGLFGKLFGMFGSNEMDVKEHGYYDEFEYPYGSEALLESDSSSVASIWSGELDERVAIDVEESERGRNSDERRDKNARRKKKQKGKHR